MATATAAQHGGPKPKPRRGRTATHDPEALLDLIGEVARAAAAAGAAVVAERISMPTFNNVKLDVDRARGLADPRTDPERTPSADAIQMRFKELAGKPVPWAELVEVALRPPEKRTMWLAALRRDEARDDLTDELVAHALRRVAHERGSDTLRQHEYEETAGELIEAERELRGDEGLLAWLLPTLNQMLAHCGFEWSKALKLAGLRPSPPPKAKPRRKRPKINPIPGAPMAQMVAVYGALNGVWPSYPTLLHFARSCGLRMANKPVSGMGPLRADATALLEAHGVPAPTRTRGGGKAKRLSYRYPVDGIPGLPLRDSDERRGQLRGNPRLGELRRELAVLSLRVWLDSTPTSAKRVRAEYVRWQVGGDWSSASTLNRHGGFAALKREAREANAEARRRDGSEVPGAALARADAIRAEMEAIDAAGQTRQPKPVPFGDALRAVLAGPHAEAEAPKQ